MTNVNENLTAQSFNQDSRDEYLARWEITVLAIILVLTLFGNCLVLTALYLRSYRGRRKKLTRMYFFVLHLSIADLLNALFNVLPQLAWDITFRFQGGPVLCKLVKFLQPLPTYLSSYVLTATAMDRYQAICHPMNYCRTTSRRSRIMIYVAWCVALVLCTPQIAIFSYQEAFPGTWDCWASFGMPFGERIYVTWFSFTVFLLPFIVLVYTYTRICYGIWMNGEISGFAKRDSSRNDQRNREPLISRAKINTVKQTITVVSLYVITSTPFIGCQLWATWDPHSASSAFFTGPTFTILALLSSLTSCVNPWIYLGFNSELRIILKEYFNIIVGLGDSSVGEYRLSWNTSTGVSTRSSLKPSRSNSSTHQPIQLRNYRIYKLAKSSPIDMTDGNPTSK